MSEERMIYMMNDNVRVIVTTKLDKMIREKHQCPHNINESEEGVHILFKKIVNNRCYMEEYMITAFKIVKI